MQKWVTSINRALQKKEEEEKGPQHNIKHVFNKESEPVEWHIATNATKKEDYHILTVSLQHCDSYGNLGFQHCYNCSI